MSMSWEDPSGSDNDEFPDLDTLVSRARRSKKPDVEQPGARSTSIRRRKLGPLSDNMLLKPWSQATDDRGQLDTPPSSASDITTKLTGRPRVQLRPRKKETIVRVRAVHSDTEKEDAGKLSVEVTLDENASADDDDSMFNDTISVESDDSDDFEDEPHLGLRRRTRSPAKKAAAKKHGQAELAPAAPGAMPRKQKDDLVGAIDRLHIDDHKPAINAASQKTDASSERPSTPPPSTPPKKPKGLVSPKKLPRIPTTPHHPSTDLFWSQDFVDDWNDEHSPKKQLFPDAKKSPTKSLASPRKTDTTVKPAAKRDAKRAFEKSKHEIAQRFLLELDQTITQGRLSELAATTGGIRITWSNKLNTTAGRANWKRETVRTRNADGTEVAASVAHRHHASIELAEKVIDDEHRLLNVVAHEFCHLANFMVSGVTNNPHGKEFKGWAAKCSREFGGRGIEVTTKHSYDIDFKYVWECTACGMEYKRHSKSVNPDRHRCGGCKGHLKQTKPVPRATAGKTSDYQKFMREQMRLMKEENPGSPQKEIMKRVADRWTSLQKAGKQGLGSADGVDEVAAGMEVLDLTSTNGK